LIPHPQHQPPLARVLLFRPSTKEVISLRNSCPFLSRVVAYKVDPDGLTAKLIFEHRRGRGKAAT
jgi:hypothetical protein